MKIDYTAVAFVTAGLALWVGLSVYQPDGVFPTDPKYSIPSWERPGAAPDTSAMDTRSYPQESAPYIGADNDELVARCVIWHSLKGDTKFAQVVSSLATDARAMRKDMELLYQMAARDAAVGGTAMVEGVKGMGREACTKLGVRL